MWILKNNHKKWKQKKAQNICMIWCILILSNDCFIHPESQKKCYVFFRLHPYSIMKVLAIFNTYFITVLSFIIDFLFYFVHTQEYVSLNLNRQKRISTKFVYRREYAINKYDRQNSIFYGIWYTHSGGCLFLSIIQIEFPQHC